MLTILWWGCKTIEGTSCNKSLSILNVILQLCVIRIFSFCIAPGQRVCNSHAEILGWILLLYLSDMKTVSRVLSLCSTSTEPEQKFQFKRYDFLPCHLDLLEEKPQYTMCQVPSNCPADFAISCYLSMITESQNG